MPTGWPRSLDGNALTYGSFMDQLYGDSFFNYNRAVYPATGRHSPSTSASTAAKAQKKYNLDPPTYSSPVGPYLGIRKFRHKNNTLMNGLCGDGHVEGRLIGTAMGPRLHRFRQPLLEHGTRIE